MAKNREKELKGIFFDILLPFLYNPQGDYFVSIEFCVG